MLDYFIQKVDELALQVDSIIITEKGHTMAHYFSEDNANNIRSISKTISCLGAYKAMERGLYNLETPILQFFNVEKINNDNISRLEKMKIRHLLNLTIGQDVGLMFSKDIKKLPENTDYVYYILNYPIKYSPGTHFVYNNAATYLLCAITQELTGMYFGDWVQETLFDRIHINKSFWECSSQGICLGASGLRLRNSDLHKIGLILLNNGTYNDEQIIDHSWIELMHTPQFFTANLPDYVKKQGRCINKMSYGFGLWICGDGSVQYPKTHYFCDGTDGQLLIIVPQKEMVITILSHQHDMNPLYEILRYYIE